MTPRGRDARERVLSTAYSLFTLHGLNAVGVDRVVAESGVAKSTLYRHFPTKDHLLIAVLDRRDLVWTQGWLRPEVERRATTPGGRLLAIFEALDEWFHREDFEGCLFVNSLLETRNRSSPVRAATVVGMTRVRIIALELAEQAEARDPQSVAHKLHMLVTGSIVGAEQGQLDAAARAGEVARLILEQEGIAPDANGVGTRAPPAPGDAAP
jgi:AcrR family transcriptional regulator